MTTSREYLAKNAASTDLSWLDEPDPEPKARPLWAREMPIPLRELSKIGDALGLLYGEDVRLIQHGQHLVAFTTGEVCGCHRCNDQLDAVMGHGKDAFFPTHGMVICPDCGNKRCPKATFHVNLCTKSNEPGQKGSVYA